MNHIRVRALSAVLCGVVAVGSLYALKPQPWNLGEVESPHSGLTRFDVLIAGRALEARRPEGVRVYQKYAGFCDVVVQEVEILTVIKGRGLVVHDVIPVLIIPEITDVVTDHGAPPLGWTVPQALEYHDATGKFPTGLRLRKARAFVVGEERVFALFKPQFRDNVEGEWLVWSGADSLRGIPDLHALTVSRPLVGDGSDVAALVRYVQIDKVADMDERIRLLAEHSLAVLRDPEAPEVVAKAAILDLRRQFDNSAWPSIRTTLEDGRVADIRERHTAEYLTDAEMTELVNRALNSKTPLGLRRELVWMFSMLLPAEVWRPYRVDPTGFLELVKNRSDDFDLRRAAVTLLDHVGDERVSQTFRALLSQGTEEDRRLLFLTREASLERQRKRKGKP